MARHREPSSRPVRSAAPVAGWAAPVVIELIPERGLHRELAPDPQVCAALAATANVERLSEFSASFDLAAEGQGRVRVTGRVTAKVGQVCVVTLEPIENAIDEPVDVLFVPPDQLGSVADDADDGDEAHDAPEPITEGTIDLARLATDVLFLAIDPYPRKPDVVFEQRVAPDDPGDHPFAALQRLKTTPESNLKKPAKG